MSDLIDRQAAIDALGEEPEVWSGNDEYAQGLNNQWHYDVNALKAVPSAQPEHNPDDERKIADLHKMVNYLLSRLEQRWIPVTERLPEKYGNYLISIHGENEPDIGTINPNDKRGWSLCDANGFHWASDKELIVTAWMPLPEPWKEGGQDG